MLLRPTSPGYVHDVSAIQGIIEGAGFRMTRDTRHGLWYAAVFDRVS